MSTLSSILGTDLISNAPSVLNGNFSALNVDKVGVIGGTLTSPSLIGIPTAPTASITSNNNQIATTGFVQSIIGVPGNNGMTTFVINNPARGGLSSGTRTLNSSVTAYVEMFYLPQNITVNKVSCEVTASPIAGSIKYGIYSIDGQTIKASMVIASIAANDIKITPVSSVVLAAGNYYQVLTPLEAVINLRATTADNTPLLSNSVIGKPVWFSSVLTTSGNLPSSFDPTTLVGGGLTTTNIRLDN